MRRLLLSLTIICLVGCNKTDLPLYVKLGDLRVLTLKADQSEVNPGTSVTLQPVISDLDAGGRTLTVTVQSCIDPGVSVGALPQCLHPDSSTSSTFATSTLSSNGTFTGLAPSFVINVPAAPANYVAASPIAKYNGVIYLVIYTITAPDGTSVTSFKRLIVSDPSKTQKNANPAISSVTVNGTALAATTTFSSAGMDFNPIFSVAGESYQMKRPDGTLVSFSETLTNTWFYTDGSSKYFRTLGTDSDHWDPPSAKPTGRAAAVVLVSHDGRDGEDFKIFEFN